MNTLANEVTVSFNLRLKEEMSLRVASLRQMLQEPRRIRTFSLLFPLRYDDNPRLLAKKAVFFPMSSSRQGKGQKFSLSIRGFGIIFF